MPITPAKIASALSLNGRAEDALDVAWPLILAGLDEFGINSDLVQVAVAATIAVECPSWVPAKEIHASQDRQPDLWAAQERYWPSGFYGRGFVQTTWRENYDKTGQALGLFLVDSPDLLLDPANAARALAYFFATHHAATNANARNWRGVRWNVNGGNNGMEPFMDAVDALLAVV